MFELSNLPVLRHVAQPLDAGGLQPHIGVKAPHDSLVDDGLALLLQQGDELLLGADVAVDEVGGVVEVADDGVLFFSGGNRYLNFCELGFRYGRVTGSY